MGSTCIGIRRSIVPLLASLSLAALPSALPGQTPPRDTDVLMSVSGGISRGSYQAGLTWTLVESYRSERRDPAADVRHHIVGLTGASAGNINAVLTALQWCVDGGARPPEESLFWKIWIPTGWEQLFPEDVWGSGPPGTMGIFTRAFSDRHHFPLLRKWMDDAGWPDSGPVADCRIPIAITLTRLNVEDVEVARGISAANQRYAAALEVRSDGNGLVFGPPPRQVREASSLGRIVFLNPVGAAAPGSRPTVPPETVFDVVEASSAFPVAFAPVELEYLDPLAADDCRTFDRPRCLRSAWFMDGGFFDNNPIDLAVGMDRTIRPARPGHPQLVYINPGRARGTILSDVAVSGQGADPEYRAGLSAIMEVLGGFVPAARQYELASFARSIDRDPSYFSRDSIRATDRALPNVSDFLGAFAAFLGRPFREYDFMVGVYDGLHHLAREECLAQPRGVTSACVFDRVRALIVEGHLGFEPLHTAFLERLVEWESNGSIERAFPTTEPPPGLSAVDALRFRLMASVARAMAASVDPAQAKGCSSGDVVQRLMCADGLGVFLETFAADAEEVLNEVPSLPGGRPPGACEDPDEWNSLAVCLVDGTLIELRKDPEAFASRIIEDVLHQMRRVEERLDEQEYGNQALVVQVGSALNQTVFGERYATGFDLNSSHVPKGMRHSWIETVIPNYLSTGMGSEGWEIGYRPAWHVTRPVALGFTVVPLRRKAQAPRGLVDRWAVAVGPRFKTRWLLVPTVELAADLTFDYPPGRPVLGYSTSIYGLAGLLRFNVRWVPQDPALDPGDHAVWSIGLADVNGLGRDLLGRIF